MFRSVIIIALAFVLGVVLMDGIKALRTPAPVQSITYHGQVWR